MATPCVTLPNGKTYTFDEFATLLHDGELNNLVNNGTLKGDFVKDIPDELKVVKNEAIPTTNIPTNGNVQPRVEPMAEMGVEQKPTTEVIAEEGVQPTIKPKPTKGETKITQEPTLEDISNFLNEQFTKNESDTGTKETSSKKDTELRSETKQSAESEQKEKGLVKKISLKGRTPIGKRRFKGDMAKANAVEPSDVRSMVLSHFLTGAKVASSEISSRGELKKKNNGFYGIATSKGKTIDAIVHDIWESQENQSLKIETSFIKDMVLEVIDKHDKVQDIADSILKNYGIESSQNKKDFSEDLQVYQEVLEEEKPSEKDLLDAYLMLSQLSDAEILELVSEEEKSYEDYLKDLEERQVTFDWGPFAELTGTIQNDGNIISEDGNVYDKQFITKLNYVNKKQVEKTTASKSKETKPDATLLKEVDEKIEQAREKVRVAKDALDRKAKSLDKEMVKDQENLFGERKSSAEAKLFDERVDAQAREKATETERNNIKIAQDELKKLIQTKKDIESGKITSNQVDLEDVANEENKQSKYKFSNSPSLKNAQAVDSSVLPITSKATENILKNEGNWDKAIIGGVKNLGNGWFEVGKTAKGESVLYSPTTDKAVTIVDSENKGGRNAVYVNDFVNNNPTISEKQQRKDKANAEVDKIANKIKDLLPGIKDPDLNKQGFSQDQLIDLVAKAVKNLINAGIEIDEAIKQVAKSIKDKFGIDVNPDDVKSRLEPKEEVEEEPTRTFERKQGELSVLNRLKKGGNQEKFTNAIEDLGTKYDVRNQDKVAKGVTEFVDEIGVFEAYRAINEGSLKNDDVIMLVYNEIIQRMPNEIEKALEGINDENQKYNEEQSLYEEYARISKEFADKAKSMGQGISILNYIYNQNANIKYDLTRQIDSYKASNNGEIPESVLEAFKEADAKLKVINEKIKKAEEDLKKAEEEIAIKNIQEDIKKQSKKTTAKKPYLSEEEQKRKNQLRSKFFGTLNDVTRFAVIIADPEFREYIKLTLKEAKGEFREFAEEMLKTLGKGARKYLPELYTTAGGKGDVDTKFLNNVKISKDGKISIPEQMIRDYVEEGYTEIDDLAKVILETIKDEYPDVDIRDIRDAITKYGKTINPSKDEISAQVRKMKRIGKLISALEDAYSGKRPKRSGLQRDELTQQEREMKRELNDLLRDLPMDDADISKRWKTALDAVKSRLKNSIEDLEKQIANKEKSKPAKNSIQYDEEAKSLEKQRNELRKTLEDLVGKTELTEEQKIAKTESYIIKSIEKLREQIDTNNIAFRQKPNPVTSAKIETLKNEQSALRKQLSDLRKDAGLVEAKRLETAKKSVKNRIAELEKRIKEGDFSKKEIKPLIPDTELTQLQAEKIRVQEIFDSEKYKKELADRKLWQKILDSILEVWNVPRILKATGEISTVLIQGGILTVSRKFSNPIELIRIMKKLFLAIGSDRRAREYESLIKAHPLYLVAEKSKLALTNPDYKTGVREEQYTGDYMNLIWDSPIYIAEGVFKRKDITNKEVTPIGNKAINKIKELLGKERKEIEKVKVKEQWKNINPFVALERGGTLYMNQLRFEEFVRGCEKLQLEGKNPIDNISDYKLLANAINSMTGRANIGTLATNSKVLAALFFSFRNWVSVVNQMNPIYYGYLHFAGSEVNSSNWYKKTSVANKLAVTNMLRFITITGTTIIALKALAGKDDDDEDVIEIETDPRSSDFMKLKIGNIRFDPWHGQSTQVVFMARMLTDEKKSTSTGEIKKLGEGYGGVKSRGDLTTQYVSNKFAPSMAILWKYMNTHEGYDKLTGEKIRLTPYGEVYDTSDESLNLTPMYWASLQEIQAEDPNAWAQFLTVASFFGINSSVYKETNTQEKLEKAYLIQQKIPQSQLTKEEIKKNIVSAEKDLEQLKEFVKSQKKDPNKPYYISKDVRWTKEDLSINKAEQYIDKIERAVLKMKKDNKLE